jgi:polyhydroxybutyrate depolymerase
LSKRKKILVIVLAIVIGVPVALYLVARVYFRIADKTNGTIDTSGVARRYLLYVPKSYDRTKPTPLVISLHPAATWPSIQMNISRWNDLADEHGFIVVYPEGIGAFFGGVDPGPQIWPMDPDYLGREVKFFSDLIDKLESVYNIDPNRVYVNGMSIGGGMAFALSCKLPDRIAAIGAVAPALLLSWDQCTGTKPVPTVEFHGTADKAAPYNGGRSPVAPRIFPSVPDWAARVAQKNQCTGEPSNTLVTPDVRRLAYTNCAANADMILYTIEGGGHTWPGGEPLPEWIAGRTTNEISATTIMWDFYTQHPRAPK